MRQDKYESLPNCAGNLCMMLEQLDHTVDTKFLSSASWLAEIHRAVEMDENEDENAQKTLQKIAKTLGDHEFEKVILIGSAYLNAMDEIKALIYTATDALNQASLEQKKAALKRPINPAILAKLKPDPVAADDLLNVVVPLFAGLTQDERDRLLQKISFLMDASPSQLGAEGMVLVVLGGALGVPTERSPHYADEIRELEAQIKQLKQEDPNHLQEIKRLSKKIAEPEKYLSALELLSHGIKRREIAPAVKPDLSVAEPGQIKTLISNIDIKKGEISHVALMQFISKKGVFLGEKHTLRDCFEPELSEQLDTLIKTYFKKLKFNPNALKGVDSQPLTTLIEMELSKSGLLDKLMQEKLNKDADPALFSFLHSELEAEIRATLKDDLENRLHPVSVFRENRVRITSTSVLTALLLADLITIAFSSSLLWLQIALPISVAVIVAFLTLAIGLTNRISPKTKQLLAKISMVFIAAVSLFGSLITLGVFAKHSALLAPLLPLLPGAPAPILVGTIGIVQIMLVLGIVLLATAALWQLYLASEELGMMSKAQHLLKNPDLEEQQQQGNNLEHEKELAEKKQKDQDRRFNNRPQRHDEKTGVGADGKQLAKEASEQMGMYRALHASLDLDKEAQRDYMNGPANVKVDETKQNEILLKANAQLKEWQEQNPELTKKAVPANEGEADDLPDQKETPRPGII